MMGHPEQASQGSKKAGTPISNRGPLSTNKEGARPTEQRPQKRKDSTQRKRNFRGVSESLFLNITEKLASSPLGRRTKRATSFSGGDIAAFFAV